MTRHIDVAHTSSTERGEPCPPELSKNQACRAADDLHRLEETLGDAQTVVPGSMGQEKVNPLFAEVRASRALLTKLVSQLQAGVKGPLTSSQKGIAAARARWGGQVVQFPATMPHTDAVAEYADL